VKTLRNILFGVYAAICLASQIWPGYDWLGNGIEPYVLGVPKSLAWVVGWIVLTFLVMVVYYATDPNNREAGE
jgi:predicted PurR-regulated permease PerM